MKDNPRINGLMINFLTPPPESKILSLEEKRKVVEEILALKKEGYPILNSKKALKELLMEDYSEKMPLLGLGVRHAGPQQALRLPDEGRIVQEMRLQRRARVLADNQGKSLYHIVHGRAFCTINEMTISSSLVMTILTICGAGLMNRRSSSLS